MIRLHFALWRRDVAIRKEAAYEAMPVRTKRDSRRQVVLHQRAQRWQKIADVIEAKQVGGSLPQQES